MALLPMPDRPPMMTDPLRPRLMTSAATASMRPSSASWEKASAFRSDLRRLSPVLRQINQELADVTGADLEPPIAVRKPDR
jgi:hypothetical protein